MLPFLKKSQEGSASLPIDTIKRESDDGSEFDVLEACAQDILDAVENKDVQALASALRSAIELAQPEGDM
jgi:hypothetical protein